MSDSMHGLMRIFIGGCDRSGTTLLGSMIGSAENLLCMPEGQFIAELSTPADCLSDADAARIKKAIQFHKRFRLWGKDLTSFFNADHKTCTYAEIIDELARAYGRKIGRTDISGWIDHSPNNVKHFYRLSMAIPDAKFLHVFRDGRAVANSWMPLDWGPNDPAELANVWLQNLAFGFAAGRVLPPDRLLHIRYEELIAEPARVMREVADFLGIPYSEKLLETNGLEVLEYIKIIHALVGKRLDTDRSTAWQKTFGRRNIELFEFNAGDMLEYLGYKRFVDYKIRPPTVSERIGFQYARTVRKILNRLREWKRAKASIAASNKGRLCIGAR